MHDSVEFQEKNKVGDEESPTIDDVRIELVSKGNDQLSYDKQIMFKTYGRYEEEGENTIKQVKRDVSNQKGSVW
mgnify:CR=1 FL=1|jgi:hypothetical protein